MPLVNGRCNGDITMTQWVYAGDINTASRKAYREYQVYKSAKAKEEERKRQLKKETAKKSIVDWRSWQRQNIPK